MLYIRTAKTRGGNDVRIFFDAETYVLGCYWSESERCMGWIPVRWSKLSPFVNGTKISGLDLIEEIK